MPNWPNVLHALLMRVRTSVRYYVLRNLHSLYARKTTKKQITRHDYLRATFLRDTSAQGYVPDPPSLFSRTGGSGDETNAKSQERSQLINLSSTISHISHCPLLTLHMLYSLSLFFPSGLARKTGRRLPVVIMRCLE